MGYIAGIGGANMDIHGRSDQPLIMRDSNPGTMHTSLGGVCRNICENLARLGEDVRLVTVVGDDVHGRSILAGCTQAGIDMSAARVLQGERSSSYISVMDSSGDMLLAMSDMHIIKKLDERLVDDSQALLCGAEDTNLVRRGGAEAPARLRARTEELCRMDANALSVAAQLDAECIAANLSPGGCADLLAVAYFFFFFETAEN